MVIWSLVKRNFHSLPRLKHEESRKEASREQSRPEKPGKASNDKRTDRSQSRKKPAPPNATPRLDKRCDGCGRLGHLRAECRLANVHPDFNKTGKWSESEAGKTVAELKFDTRLNGDRFDFEAAKKAADAKGLPTARTYPHPRKDGAPDRKKHKTSKCSDICACIYDHNHIDLDKLYVLNRYRSIDESYKHTVLATIYANNLTLNIHILLDTGALQSNYVSSKIATWMENNKIDKKIARKASRVCSAFATCKLINHSFITKISFLYINKKSRIDKDRSNRNRLSLPDKEGESIVKNDTNGRKRRVSK